MNNIYVFEEAQNAYIDEELLHLSTALSTVSKIIKRFCVLRTCAQTSAPSSRWQALKVIIVLL